MKAELQGIVKEIEDIKERLISVEMRFLETEEATAEDRQAVEEALREHKLRKTASLDF